MIIKKILKISLVVLCSVVVTLSLIFAALEIKKELYFDKELSLPVVYVNTENEAEITSKEEYVNCKVSITNTSKKYSFSNQSAGIRGRGNSTWTYPKKPYRLKFDEKIDIFGNGAAKSWTLIADYKDESLMRNRLAYAVAAQMENLAWTTSAKSVDLFVNGEYAGVYLLCEQVQTGETRVDIDESLESVDTGYLIEMDQRAPLEGKENVDYFWAEDLSFAIKTPDVDDEGYTVNHLNFIKDYVSQVFTALKSGSFEDVSELVDVESFAETYIVHELFKNVDVFVSSFYMYKDAGGKLCAGPVWDFDLSCASEEVKTSQYNYSDKAKTPNAIYAIKNKFYGYLLNIPEFKELVSKKIIKYETVVKSTIESECNNVLKNESDSFERNFMKWGSLWERVIHINTWEKDVQYVKDFLNTSYDYMKAYYEK